MDLIEIAYAIVVLIAMVVVILVTIAFYLERIDRYMRREGIGQPYKCSKCGEITYSKVGCEKCGNVN